MHRLNNVMPQLRCSIWTVGLDVLHNLRVKTTVLKHVYVSYINNVSEFVCGAEIMFCSQGDVNKFVDLIWDVLAL